MSLSADALYKMSDLEVLAAYAEARRQFVEKKFTRDTHRARLEWIKANMFVSGREGSPSATWPSTSRRRLPARVRNCAK